MSQQYDNTNRGIIAKNDRKTQDNHPDITGSINVNGVEYWLNGWHKTGSKGPFYSLSVKPKEAKQEQRSDEPRRPVPPSFDERTADDDIPF